MKKLLMICAIVMLFGVGQAMAQNYAVVADGAKPFDSEATLAPGQQVTIDIYLQGTDGTSATAGGAWVDFSGSASEIMYVSAGRALTDGSEGPTGPWDPLAGVIVDEPAGVGTLMIIVGNLGGAAPDGDNDIIVGRVVLECTGAVDANVNITTIPATATWGPNPPYDDDTINQATVNPVLVVHQICECTTDAQCQDDLWCNGEGETCIDCVCSDAVPSCDDGDECTIDGCDEDTDTCLEKECDESVIDSGLHPCCQSPGICSADGADPSAICDADVTIIKEDGFYQPPQEGQVVTIKNRICMDNPGVLVGGVQFDICDEPDCIECIDCELTERTVMFDCVVLELPDGCCRVIMFCKNPGCAINPGFCQIVTVVMQTKEDAPEECGEDCIEESIVNIVASDYDGYLLASAGLGGELCPIVCGDVCPPGSGTANDCGDGVVDIYDIMCEVDFALTATTPNSCQLPRADVPTGTPPDCTGPDGSIDILDIMVLIDMALNRQDCCSFYYLGIIY